MGICEALTFLFVVLKLAGLIDWSWFWVLFPEILAGVFYILTGVCAFRNWNWVKKRIDKEEKKWL